MKRLLFLVACFAFLTAESQTADDVIQKYTTAIGGLDAINKVQTAKMTGTVSVQGMDLPVTLQIINGKAMRSDIDIMGQAVINAYKDGKGWKINPFAGASSATEVAGTELNDLKSQSMLVSQLMDYKARGHKVELSGQEDVDGMRAFKIKLIDKDNGKLTSYFISLADNMLIKFITSKEIQGQDVELENYFSNFKEFNGVKFSMTRMQKIGGEVFSEMRLSSIELNVPIDEKIFDIPK